MFRKKLKIVVFDHASGKYRNTTVPFEYRFRWIAENAWADLEWMRSNLGFNQWHHVIVPIDFNVECPYEAI